MTKDKTLRLNQNGFPILKPQDKAPPVRYNPITQVPNKLPTYSNEQKARKRRSKNFKS